MRIHEGNFAYDLEQQIDPLTQLRSHWKYTVFELRPLEKALNTGQAATRPEAEDKAKKIIARLLKEHPKVAA
jgi:hypothetical protein